MADVGPSAQSVGREFVRQYYTMLNERPDCLHRSVSVKAGFQHSVMQRNVMQRKNFYGTKTCCILFLHNCRPATALAASCGTLQANINEFYFFCNAGRPEENSTNQRCDYGCGPAEWHGLLNNK